MREPKWITAKFKSNCRCGTKLNKGDSILYIPQMKKAFCCECGDEIWKGVLAERSYEEYGTDCMYDC